MNTIVSSESLRKYNIDRYTKKHYVSREIKIKNYYK